MSDISELFARDPFELTREDIDAIVAKLRASRKQFNMGNAQAGNMKKKQKLSEGEAKNLLDKLL